MKLKLAILLTAAVTSLALVPDTAFAQTPSQATVDAAKRSGPCGDPWVTIAIAEATGGGIPAGRGDQDQCNTKLYNNGSWANYQELLRGVNATLRNFQTQGAEISMRNGQPAFVITDMPRAIAAGIVGQDAASLIGKGGAGIVAAGGGNIVAAGGGNIADRTAMAANERVAVRLPSGKTLFVRIQR